MPNRMLRDWTQSDKIDLLSAQAETFFTRLIMKVDDYGCFFADVRLLKANLFPLKLDKIREADLTRWVAECHKAGLIVLYEVNQKKYLQILEFRQRLDKAKAKFPLPSEVTDLQPGNEPLTTSNESMAELEEKLKEKQKENEVVNGGKPPTHSQEEIDLFKNFTGYILKNAANVGKMKEPFTIDQYVKLKKRFSNDYIKKMLQRMHNYQPLLKKNNCAYLTFINWSEKNFEGTAHESTPLGTKLSDAVKAIEHGITG